MIEKNPKAITHQEIAQILRLLANRADRGDVIAVMFTAYFGDGSREDITSTPADWYASALQSRAQSMDNR